MNLSELLKVVEFKAQPEANDELWKEISGIVAKLQKMADTARPLFQRLHDVAYPKGPDGDPSDEEQLYATKEEEHRAYALKMVTNAWQGVCSSGNHQKFIDAQQAIKAAPKATGAAAAIIGAFPGYQRDNKNGGLVFSKRYEVGELSGSGDNVPKLTSPVKAVEAEFQKAADAFAKIGIKLNLSGGVSPVDVETDHRGEFNAEFPYVGIKDNKADVGLSSTDECPKAWFLEFWFSMEVPKGSKAQPADIEAARALLNVALTNFKGHISVNKGRYY